MAMVAIRRVTRQQEDNVRQFREPVTAANKAKAPYLFYLSSPHHAAGDTAGSRARREPVSTPQPGRYGMAWMDHPGY